MSKKLKLSLVLLSLLSTLASPASAYSLEAVQGRGSFWAELWTRIASWAAAAEKCRSNIDPLGEPVTTSEPVETECGSNIDPLGCPKPGS